MMLKVKKTRRILQIVTIVLGLLTITSILLSVISPKDVTETTAEIISIVVGVSALAIAIIAQISATQEEKRLQGIITDLRNVIKDNRKEFQFDEEMNAKLDKILAAEEHKK